MTYENEAVTATLRAQLRVVRGGGEASPKRLVAIGREGPAFGARAEVVYVVGRVGLKPTPAQIEARYLDREPDGAA